MNKSKESLKKTIKESLKKSGKYLREISVVVLGVAITLSVSYLIGIKKEKRDMELHLRAIRMESEENAKDIGHVVASLKPACKYTDYLRSHDKKSLHKDTLNSYFSICYDPPRNFTFKTNAFEMFKNSGTMRLMNDKALLMEIWNVYDALAYMKEQIDEHNRLKWNFIEKEISLIDVNRGENEWSIIPMYDFYKKTDVTSRLLIRSELFLKITQELVQKLILKQFESSKLKTYKVTDEDLDKYLGVYSIDQYPVTLTITKENKVLFAQYTGGIPYPFHATAKNRFELDNVILEFNPADKTVLANRDGRIFILVREE